MFNIFAKSNPLVDSLLQKLEEKREFIVSKRGEVLHKLLTGTNLRENDYSLVVRWQYELNAVEELIKFVRKNGSDI